MLFFGVQIAQHNENRKLTFFPGDFPEQGERIASGLGGKQFA